MNALERQLFAEAAALPPDERPAFLEEACRDQPALRARIEELLRSHDDSDFMIQIGRDDDATLGADPRGHPFTEAEGDRVGPYILRQQIGEGGFGVVWMAEQNEPIQRMVAVKVIKAGMDTRQVLARFEAERQALAMMDHPNIARVLDAGTTDSGRPYFAMELVRGIPVTQFCDEQDYEPRRRLELFRDICSAVNHAHQKGIIHRDIKPSNVLVTLVGDEPVAKVIDFGIAKATRNKLTDRTLFTRFEQFMGTPAYMSPEQASMGSLDIDTRSDIYSLGVLLYELLAGSPPFDLRMLLSGGYDEMRRIIQEEDPPTPSTRLAQTQSRVRNDNQIPPTRDRITPRTLKGELDWIVMKTIAKDRTRRYETVNALAADIGRYLANEPVQAGAPGAAYKLRKFARRHRTGIGISTLLIALSAGVTARHVTTHREAEAQFTRLLNTTVEDASSLVPEVRRWLPIVENKLILVSDGHGMNPDGEIELQQRINASLVLAPSQPAANARLANWLLYEERLTPEELIAIQDGLIPKATPLAITDAAWRLLGDSSEIGIRRLRAAALLAKVDPISSRWKDVLFSISLLACEEGPFAAADWAPLLDPVAPALIEFLERLFWAESQRPTGSGAAVLLARYHRYDPSALANLLVITSDPLQFSIILKSLRSLGPTADEPLRAMLARSIDAPITGLEPGTFIVDPAPWRSKLHGFSRASQSYFDNAKTRSSPDLFPSYEIIPLRTAVSAINSIRRARAALALFSLGFDSTVPALTRLSACGDPTTRTTLIHSMSDYGVKPSQIAKCIREEREPSIRAALLLALGDFDRKVFTSELESNLRDILEMALSSPDSEEHSAAEWLVRWWDWGDLGVISQPDPPANPEVHGETNILRWRRNKLGLKMIQIPGPIEFMMGSPEDEPFRSESEFLHARQIPHSFEISDKVLTRRHARQLMPNLRHNPDFWDRSDLDLPVTGLSRAEARELCNLLSASEGIPESEWAYGPGQDGEIEALVRVDRFPNIQGYRLATEAEWEFAARAHATTSVFYGFQPPFLPRYVHVDPPSVQRRPGLLRPNSFGLFDVLGNVFEYVDGEYVSYPGGPPISGFGSEANPWPVLRGGAPRMRVAARTEKIRVESRSLIGFRVARTLNS